MHDSPRVRHTLTKGKTMTPRILTLTVAAFALTATGAMAGGWPNNPVKKSASPVADECCSLKAEKKVQATAPRVGADGFEYVGGEQVWRLAQHKYELRDGRFVQASDCPVSIARAGGNLRPSA